MEIFSYLYKVCTINGQKARAKGLFLRKRLPPINFDIKFAFWAKWRILDIYD